MKKQLLALATIAIVALTACKKDPEPQVSTSKAATKNDLLGKWDFTSEKFAISAAGQTDDTTFTYKSGDLSYEFLATDKMVISGTTHGDADTIRYAVANGKVTIFLSELNEGESDEINTATIDGKNLTLVSTEESTDGGIKVKYETTGKLTKK